MIIFQKFPLYKTKKIPTISGLFKNEANEKYSLGLMEFFFRPI